MEFHSRGFQPSPSRDIPKQPKKQVADRGINLDRFSATEAETATGTSEQSRWRVPHAPLKPLAILTALIVVALIVVFFVTRGRIDAEMALVDTSTYQAVSVQEDSYFGKITEVTDTFVVLQDIFYISTSKDEDGAETSQLIKRGCEAWQPKDKMVIYRSDVRFWENISTDGAVGKLIAQWKQQNPNGQTCNTTDASVTQTGTSSSSGTTGTNESLTDTE